MGTGLFRGENRPGRGVDKPPPSSTEVKERVELHLYSPSGPIWPVLDETIPFTSRTLFLFYKNRQAYVLVAVCGPLGISDIMLRCYKPLHLPTNNTNMSVV